MRSVLTGFKDFITRGNAIDLAVGVVLGAAFTMVITAIVDGFISPLIGVIFDQPSLTELWDISVRDSTFSIGLILDALLQFLLVAAAVYFVIVLPMNRFAERRKAGLEPEPDHPAEDVLLLQEIRDLLAAGAPGGRGGTPGGAPPLT